MVKKNVLIVDDHAVMRTGLKNLLVDFYSDLNIYESCDGDMMLEQFKKRRIDMLIMDIHIPNTDSISLVEMISIKYPKTYTLIFSMLPEHIYGKRMLKAGAKGYLPKESTISEIRNAFDHVLNHKVYISSNLTDILKKDKVVPADSNPFSQLSHREFEIVNFLLSGWNINTISQKLNLKQSTIGTYKARIFEKLQIKTIFELKDIAMLYNFNHHYHHL